MQKVTERLTESTSNDDSIERDVWTDIMLANDPDLSNIVPVNTGVAKADRYSGMRRHVVGPMLGYITIHNKMPLILP